MKDFKFLYLYALLILSNASFGQIAINFQNSNTDVGICDSRMFIINSIAPPFGGWPSSPFVISIEPFVSVYNANPLTMADPWPSFPSCDSSVNNQFSPIRLSAFNTAQNFDTLSTSFDPLTNRIDLLVRVNPAFLNSSLGPIEYTFDFDCSISNYITPGIPYYFYQRWYYQGNLINSTAVPLVVHTPEIIPLVSGIPPLAVLNAPFGSNQVWDFGYQNVGSAGNISIEDFFLDNCMTSNGQMLFQVDSLEYGISTNSTAGSVSQWTVYGVLPNDVVYLHANEYLFFRYRVNITGCATSCNAGGSGNQPSFFLRWKCGNISTPGCNFCKEIRRDVLFSVGSSSVEISRIEPDSNNVALCDTALCQGGSRHWKFQVKNIGNTVLPEVYVTLYTIDDSTFSVVPVSSVSVQTASGGTGAIDNTHSTSYSNLPMGNSTCGTPSLGNCYLNFKVVVTDLSPDSTAFVEFDVFNLYSDDTIWFNKSKIYNQWRIQGSAQTACSTFVNASYAPGTLMNSSLGISGHSNSFATPHDDLNLSAFINNNPNHTTVWNPPGSPNPNFGDPMVRLVKLTGIFGDSLDTQVMGGSKNPAPRQDISGFLKVELLLNDGLSLNNPKNISLVIDPGAPFQIFPISYGSPTDSNWCAGTYPNSVIDTLETDLYDLDYFYYDSLNCSCAGDKKYTVYFDLSSFDGALSGTGLTREDVFNNGFLLFHLTPCCPTVNAMSEYTVRISMLPNENCFSYNAGSGQFVSASGATSTPCWLPLYKESRNIFVHCPGCLAPGVIVDDYHMSRTTLGLPDSSNDGIADSPIPIQYLPNRMAPGSSYSRYKDLLLACSAYGDSLEDYLIAHFQDGDRSGGNNGYLYSDMTVSPTNIRLNYLQLFRTIPFSENSDFDINVTGFDFYVDDSVSNLPSLDTLMFSRKTKSYGTIVHFSADQSALGNFLLVTGDSLLFTFSKDDLEHLGTISGVTVYKDSSVFDYNTSQQFRLRVRYSICRNIRNQQLTNTPFTSSINNKMYLTGAPKLITDNLIQMPNTSTEVCADVSVNGGVFLFNAGNTGCVNQNPVTQAGLGNHYVYYCETFGGEHYLVSTVVGNNTYYGNLATSYQGGGKCLSNIDIRSFSFFDFQNSAKNNKMFDYEYKIPMLAPSYIKIHEPENWDWHLTNGNLAIQQASFSSLTANPNWNIPGLPTWVNVYSNATVVGDSMEIFPNGLSHYDCITSSQTSTPYVSDEKNVQRFVILVHPEACDTGTTFEIQADSRIEFSSWPSGKTCFNSPGCSIDTVKQNNTLTNSTDLSLPISHPNLGLIVAPPVANVTNTTISWYFQFYNYSLQGVSNGLATNPYFYLDIPGNPSVNVSVNYTSVSGIPNPIPPTFVNSISNPAINSFLIFDPQGDSSLNPGLIYHGILTLAFDSCPDIPDSINLIAGWNCTVPTDLDSICAKDTIRLNLLIPDPLPGQLTGTGGTTAPTVYTACDSLNPIIIQGIFTNTGSLDISLTNMTVNIPPSSIVSLVSGYPVSIDQNCQGNSGASQILTSTGINTWHVDTALLLQAGDCIVFECAILTNGCHFGPLELPTITATGTDDCGNVINGTLALPWLNQSGVSFCTDCYKITKTVNADTVIVGEGVTFTITVEGNNADTSVVQVDDLLPGIFVEAPLTTSWPVSLTVPSVGVAVPILVSGAYNDIGSCSGDPNNSTNTALIVGTSISDSACLEVICPEVDAQYSITNQYSYEYASDIFAGKNSISMATILIADYATLDFNINMNFKYCKFVLGSGAAIRVTNHEALFLLNCEFYSCPYMWKGVFVESGSIIQTDSCIIRDAEKAIFGYDNATINVHNSKILNCIVGITSDSTNSSAFHILNGELFGTEFGKTSLVLKKEYSGQTLHGKIGYAGISLKDISPFRIGENTKGENYFHDLNYGIDLTHTDAEITNCYFNKIIPDYIYKVRLDQAMGVAVHAINRDHLNPATALSFFPRVASGQTVDSSTIGLYNEYYDIRARDVKMNYVTTGIKATKNALCSNDISNFEIHANKAGVYWYNNDGAFLMRLTESIVTTTGTTGCVELHEVLDVNDAHYEIINNPKLSNINAGGSGVIRTFNVQKASIGYNLIFSGEAGATNLNSTGVGIGIHNGSGNEIYCNTTHSINSLNDTLNYGLVASISPRNSIYCNHFNNSSVGAWFGGFCDSTIYKGNAMQGNDVGLKLNSSGVIGRQRQHGNIWTVYSGTDRGINYNYSNLLLSEFVVHHPSPPTPYYPFVFPPSGWFVPGTGTPYSCSANAACLEREIDPDPSDPDYIGTETERLIALDSINFEVYNDETRSMLRQQLLENIQRDSGAYLNDSIFSAFYINNINSPGGELTNVSVQLAEALFIDQQTYNSLKLLDSLIQEKVNSLYSLDSLNLVSTVSNYKVIRNGISDSLNQLRTVVSNFLTLRAGSVGLIRDSLVLANATIQPSDLTESNRQVIFELVQKYNRYGDTILVANYTLLLSIAQQCPFEGGPAVYQARSLLRIIDENVEYYDDIICLQAGYFKSSNSTAIDTKRITLVPNPANHFVDVYCTRFVEAMGKIWVYDSFGKCVSASETAPGTKIKQIDVSTFAPGVYLVQVKIDEELFVEKLVVIN